MSLVGWWPLNEDAGDARDLSGNGNDGTVNGVAQGVAGRGGMKGASFDGSDDYVSLPSGIFQSGTSLTVSFWTISDSFNSGRDHNELFGFRQNRRFLMRHDEDANGDNAIDMWVDGTWHKSLGEFDTEHWQHIVVTYDGGTNKWVVYKNGSRIASFTDADGTGSNYNRLGNSASYYWKGQMVDLRTYNRALTDAEIQKLYQMGGGNAPFPGQPFGGVSYYPFEGDANDSWGSNDGTVNGATLVSGGGPFGSDAYDFDGTDDYIEASGWDGVGPVTASCWIQFDTTGGQRFLTSRDPALSEDDYFITRYDNGGAQKIEVYAVSGGAGSSAVISNTALSTGVWHHVLWTRDNSGNYTIYIDGKKDATGSATSGDIAEQYLEMGAYNGGGVPLDGMMDDVRIYDVALSPAQVRALYDATRGHYVNGDFAQPPTDGVSYYPFDDGTATDQWGSNDGTVNGATHVPEGVRASGAFSFDGTDDSITAPWTDPSGDLTISFWFNADGFSNFNRFFDVSTTAGDISIYQDSGSIKSRADNLAGSIHLGNASYTTSTWYHIAVTIDVSNDRAIAYRNASILNVNENSNSGIASADSDLHIGQRNDGTDEVDASIDDVRIYDRALEPWEIQELYQYGTMGRNLLDETVRKVA